MKKRLLSLLLIVAILACTVPVNADRRWPYRPNLKDFQRELQRIGGDNLVAYWPLDDKSGTTARDIGPNAEVLDITGTTLGQKGPPQLGRSHYFDGINDVDSQHAYDDETGSSWGPTVHGLSLANGSAFARVEGVDLSTFAGTEGSDTPYMLVLTDDAGGKVAWGYIAEADAAEGLGGELLTDGGLESWVDANNLTSWTESEAGTSTVNREGTEQHGGTYACRLDVDAGGSSVGIYQSRAFTDGKLHKVTLWAKISVAASGDGFYLRSKIGSALGSLNSTNTSTDLTTSYAQYTFYFTAEGVDNGLQIFRGGATVASKSIFIDDFSVQEVTHVGTDGVHIVSTKDGSTRNWADIESGLDYNDSAYTFSIFSSLFQLTGSFTIGSWLNATDATDFIILDKLSGNYGYLLNLDGSDFVNCTVGDGTDTQSATGAVAITENQWHRVIATYDGTNIRIYLDGVLIDTQAQSVPGDVSKALSIGSDGTDFAEGNQAHNFLCNAAWTAAQVKRDWDVGSRAHGG